MKYYENYYVKNNVRQDIVLPNMIYDNQNDTYI